MAAHASHMTAAFGTAVAMTGAGLSGCATPQGGPLTAESSPYRDNVVAVTGGSAAYAGMKVAGLSHAGPAGLLVGALLKLAGSMTPKDYCSRHSMQTLESESRLSGQTVGGGGRTYTQTDCVIENVTYRNGDFVTVVTDGVNKPPHVADRTFRVIEQTRNINPLTGQASNVPLVYEVTPGAANNRQYLMFTYNRVARDDQTGQDVTTSAVFLNEVNLGAQHYRPQSQQRPPAPGRISTRPWHCTEETVMLGICSRNTLSQ